jgi:hypothetical protein
MSDNGSEYASSESMSGQRNRTDPPPAYLEEHDAEGTATDESRIAENTPHEGCGERTAEPSGEHTDEPTSDYPDETSGQYPEA